MSENRQISRLVPGRLAAWAMAAWLSGGCAGLQHTNTAPYVERHIRATDEQVPSLVFKTVILYPARDYLTLDWLWRLLFKDEAWNAEGGGVGDGSFYTNRTPEELTPAAVARGPCVGPPPKAPMSVTKVKSGGGSSGFVGVDALGRTFLFKLDRPDFPELGSSAAVIGSRMLWALGYNVPAVYVTRIEGTGDSRFDGRRASASLYLDNAKGHFKFDWFRYRREVRALRMVCAWVNDTDRVGTNTLVLADDNRAAYVLIDFNSCLGSWNGRPKEPWRGHRYAGDAGHFILGVLTLGLVRAPYDPNQPIVSPAVGRFDAWLEPLRWRSQLPNTAFDRMTESDRRWITDKIRCLEREHIAAIAAEGQLTDPGDAEYLVDTLMERRAKILALAPSEPVRR
jgi:hypothetical protein